MECLSAADWTDVLGALRPRGEAWRNGASDGLTGSDMGRTLAGCATGFAETDARLCQLVDEFFCSTAVQTVDLWMLEYGLPDGCDPFADVCDKANAVGDSATAYAIAAALRRGWVITITEEFTVNAETMRCGIARCGTARFGAQTGVTWFIGVDRQASPAFVSPRFKPFQMGIGRFGRALACPASIDSLVCLIRRICPAHADYVYSNIT